MPQTSSSPSLARPLVVDGVSRSYGDRRVLSDVSFTASPGVRPARTGMLTQELPYPSTAAVRAVLDDALAEPLSALADIERAAAGLAADPSDDASATLYSDALDRAEHLGAWQMQARVADVLAGLSLGSISHKRPVGELSGGERVRLALAALVLSAPEALLLDEPSNHLDDAALAYLETVLTNWRGLVVFATHDRTLIDRVATRVLDLDPRPLRAATLADAADEVGQDPADRRPPTTAQPAIRTDDPGAGIGLRVHGARPGGYFALQAERAAELRRWGERYIAEQKTILELTHEIEVGSREVNRKHESKSESKMSRKFYSDKDAKVTARRAPGATVRLETLERERVRRPPRPLRFAGIREPATPESVGPQLPPVGATPTSESPLCVAFGLAVDGRLSPTSLSIARNGRILITGPNGSGKSTLLRVLAGELAADAGSCTAGAAASCSLLHQETRCTDPSITAEAWYREKLGAELTEQHPLSGTGLLAPRDLNRTVGQLSVGQQRRVALAALIAQPPEILLLDEPSNHLSLALVDELEEALSQFPGAVVIASHDRWLRGRWQGDELRLSPAPCV